MIGIVIVSHGAFAHKAVETLELVVGPQPKITAVGVGPEGDMEELRQKIIDSITKTDAGDGVIVFVDMFGGTPYNLVVSAMSAGNVEVIAGFNLAMLIAACSVRKEKNLSEVVEHAQNLGRRHIRVISRNSTQNKTVDDQAAPNWEDERKAIIALANASRENLLKIQELVERIAAIRPSVPGMGHNLPPDRAVIDPDLLEEGVAATELLEEELNSEKPRRKIIELCLLVLGRVRVGIVALVKWLTNKAERFLDGFIDSSAKASGTATVALIGAEAALGRLGPDLAKLLDGIRHLLALLGAPP